MCTYNLASEHSCFPLAFQASIFFHYKFGAQSSGNMMTVTTAYPIVTTYVNLW